jgi:lipopolysaccharide transport system ATP-binding protein
LFKRKKGQGFRALTDINLDVERGESVGIVGRNGAGKSTLLQIVCGTLQATTGNVEANGRLAALLELGAGFNPNFSGRENVYLNAAILGMTKAETETRFASIEEFADIGEFIDRPVRNYSSGMFVRLAFAVAIHSDPEILVVDEALSVGDEAFQRKCFGRIEDIQRRGGTILFVSHSASSVLQLCNRALFLDRGQLILEGSPKKVVTQYQRFLNLPADRAWELRQKLLESQNSSLDILPHKEGAEVDVTSLPPDNMKEYLTLDRYDPDLKSQSMLEYEQQGARIENPEIKNALGQRVNVLTKGDIYTYTYNVTITDDAIDVDAGMMIKSTSGVEISGATSGGDPIRRLTNIKAGTKLRASFTFKCDLAPNIYFLNAGVMAKKDGGRVYLHRIMDIVIFRVDSDDMQFSTGFTDLLTIRPELGVSQTEPSETPISS